MWEIINNAKIVQHCGPGGELGVLVGDKVYSLGGSQPTKLSDLENDLWYSKRELALTFTKDDFKLHDNGDYRLYYFTGEPALEWLKRISDIGFTFNYVIDGQSYTLTESEMPLEDDSYICDCGRLHLYATCDAFAIDNGYGEDSGECGDYYTLYPTDTLIDYMESFTLEIYRVDTKKVPVEFCDTTEIEEQVVSELYALAEEVWEL